VLDRLDTTPHAVVLRLFPRNIGPATTLPADWVDIAGEWVTADLGDDDPVRMRILTIESEVPAREVPGVIHECGLAKVWCDAVNGDLADRVRTASLTYGRLPHLALGAGGHGLDSSALLARYDVLEDVARELAADVAYACIDFEPTLEGLALGLSPDGWEQVGGAPVNVIARHHLADRIPDVYPYQVLGPGHLERLGDVELPGEPVGEGRFEVVIDDPRAWLSNSPDRSDARTQGWELLRPLLVSADELSDLAAARPTELPVSDVDEEELALAAATAPAPELETVVLEGSAHNRRASRLTLLELTAWLAHEPHSDNPATVSPVLATYARWLAAGLDDESRQDLRLVAPRLIGTNTHDRAAERTRSWMAVEWLVRVQAPAWLRAAGLIEAGDRLAAIGSLTDDLELVRAVELLGTAIAIASRRIEVTASVVDDGQLTAEPDDQIVWEAWEKVTESTGWVAASEAATYGAPAEVIYATDLRVIECSRSPKARGELEATRQSIGDSAWSTALHAIADEAWEQGWRAADTAARELSGFTIRVEMGRVAKTVLERDATEELPEQALEQAERAARDSLTRAALRGGVPETGPDGSPREHPWEEARNAARVSEGGAAWSVVIDEARRAVGEDGWAQGMADARAVVTAMLAIAPDTVARIVVASVAREASSAAARGVAFRAAAVARANGGGDAEAAAAANEALERVAVELRAEARSLLEELIGVRIHATAQEPISRQ
jgi:hypothetical protein